MNFIKESIGVVTKTTTTKKRKLEFKKPSQPSSLIQAATLENILEQMKIPLKALEKKFN